MARLEPLITHTGIAATLNINNIDTDQIIPSREMRKVSREGLGEGLFAGWRYEKPGSRNPNSDFILNQPAYAGVSILLTGKNFGCGSSREHAVWAIAEYGIRVIIAESFGSIFRNNCARNGILAVVAEKSVIKTYSDSITPDPQSIRIAIDLPHQTLRLQRVDGATDDSALVSFEIDAYHKSLLMSGMDPITLTQSHQAKIDAFFDRDREERPWVYQ